MSVAADSDNNANVFFGMTDVIPISEVLLLPEAEAEKWKGDWKNWTDHLSPAALRDNVRKWRIARAYIRFHIRSASRGSGEK